MPDNNKEILAKFKTMPSCTAAELHEVDWSELRELAVIKGSLEIDEALTGIVVADVSGRLVGFRNICTGRQPAPVREYFAIALNRMLGQRGVQLADWRIVHRESPNDEYRKARQGLRGCVQQMTGLQGLSDVDESDPDAWVAKNPGFCDMQHDLVILVKAFFTAPKAQPSFTAIMEVVPGMQVLQDKMTLRQALSINAAQGIGPESKDYVLPSHDNPLHLAEDLGVRERVLQELGRLTALDAILNNWDRVGLKFLWDNKGNLTNLCVERVAERAEEADAATGTAGGSAQQPMPWSQDQKAEREVDNSFLRIVGVDQAVQPIRSDSPGLDTYRHRLRTLVEFALRMESTDFRDLPELDVGRSPEAVIAAFVEEESDRERREQDTIMGRVAQHDGLIGSEAGEKDNSPAYVLQDLAKELYFGTGVLFDLSFLGRHFVTGLVAGLRNIREAGRDETALDELLRRVADEVRAAFAGTEAKLVDLEGELERSADFVRGNVGVVRDCFLSKKLPLQAH